MRGLLATVGLAAILAAGCMAQVCSGGCTLSGGATVATNVNAPTPVITSAPPVNGVVGLPYTFTFTATGGSLPYVWSFTGTIPHGLSLNAGTGVMSGTPDTETTYNFVIVVTDAAARTASAPYSVIIAGSLGPLVDVAGTDSGTCLVSPCATVAYALTQSSAGQQVSINPGHYPIALDGSGRMITWKPTTSGSGTGADRITIKGVGAQGTVWLTAGIDPDANPLQSSVVNESVSCGTNCNTYHVDYTLCTTVPCAAGTYTRVGPGNLYYQHAITADCAGANECYKRRLPTAIHTQNAVPNTADIRMCKGNVGTQITQSAADTLCGCPVRAAYATSHSYTIGDVVQVVVGGTNELMVAGNAGTSAGSAPTWPTNLWDTVVDNNITWTYESNQIHCTLQSTPCTSGATPPVIATATGTGATVTASCSSSTTGCNVYAGQVVTVAGLSPAAWNGNKTVTAADNVAKTFTFSAGTSGSSTTTGTVTISAPWFCYNKVMVANTGATANVCSFTNLDKFWVELRGGENWTMFSERAIDSNCGQASENYAGAMPVYMAGIPALGVGQSGPIPGHDLDIWNAPEMAAAGTYYDDCNNVSAGAGKCRLFFYADTSIGENPAVDKWYFSKLPLATPQALYATNWSHIQLQNVMITGDNYQLSILGTSSTSTQPYVANAVEFRDVNDITLEQMQIFHTNGACLAFKDASGFSSPITADTSAFYDCGGQGISVGELGSSTDTNDNVPQNFTFTNNVIDSPGRIDWSGEGAIFSIGDAHNVTATHNQLSESYTGGFAGGQSLNRTVGNANCTGTVPNQVCLAYFTYGLDLEFNLIYGAGFRSNAGNDYALGGDYGAGVHFANSLSTMAPKTSGQPVADADFSGIFRFNVVHDTGSNYPTVPNGGTLNTDQGSIGCYFDGGTSYDLCQQNLFYRIGQGCWEMTGANDPVPWAAQYVSTWNTFKGNVCAFPSSTKYKGSSFAPRLFNKLGLNQANAVVVTNNVYYWNTGSGGLNTRLANPQGSWAAFDGTQATVTAPGSGYTGSPSCSVTGLTCSTNPTCYVVKSGTTIGQVYISEGGQSCTGTPAISITGGSGSGATATVFGLFRNQVTGNLAIPASGNWQMNNNDYMSTAIQQTVFHTCTTTVCSAYNASTIFPWSGTDATSVYNQDPVFINPIYPTDNFTLTSPPAILSGLTWNYNTAGPQAPLISPPNQNHLYGSRTMSAATDF